jgi:hypothetical protein
MRRTRTCCLLSLVLATSPAQAHHSYADFDRDHPSRFTGTVTDIFWGNPHILFTLQDDTSDMRIEWVTTAGADVTGVGRQQIGVGDIMTVVGSRHLDPHNHTMTMVQELRIPARNWHWISPSLQGKRP